METLPAGIQLLMLLPGVGEDFAALLKQHMEPERLNQVVGSCYWEKPDATSPFCVIHLRTMTDRTVLLITHRPAALDICDKQIPF